MKNNTRMRLIADMSKVKILLTSTIEEIMISINNSSFLSS